RGNGLAGRFNLELAQIRHALRKLSMQAGQLHLIEIRQHELADSRTGPVRGDRAAQSSQANNWHPGASQPLLSGHIELGQHNLTAITQQLVISKLSISHDSPTDLK